MNLFSAIRNAINPPKADPLRFAGTVQYIAGWNGELEGIKGRSNVNDRVRIDDGGIVEFLDGANPYSGVEIPKYLTSRDKVEIRKKNLNPDNPKYQDAKAYFALHPSCQKEDMAAACNIGDGTAKDLIPSFKRAISPSPTTESTRFSWGE